MTVSVDADLRIREYAGDDSANPRPVPFRFLDNDALKVTRTNADGSETVLVRGTHFSVAGAGNLAGGSVTPLAPIAAGTSWRIEGDMSLEQPTDYTAGDDFPAESHERGLDRSMIAHQEARRDINDVGSRALRVRRGETLPELPSAGDRAGTYAAYDAIGRPIGASGTGNDSAFRTDMAQDDGGENVGIKRPIAHARRQTAQEILVEQLLTPDTFRQPGDTVLLRLQRFLDALGNGRYGRLDANYIIPSQLVLTDRSHFRLDGNGYTIKLANGAATGYGGSAIYIARCQNFEISDLIFDGNRANRVVAEDPAHVVVIDKCNDWKFSRVQANNGTSDGFYIGAGAGGSGVGGAVTLADVPQRWVMEDCVALGNYRQGCSVIEGMWGTFLRGRYGLTSGLWDAAGSTGPCAGIDCESDQQPTWAARRIQHIDFIEVLFDQNQGPGLLLTNIDGTRHFRVIDCKFDRNKKAAIESVADMVEIIRPNVTGWDQVDYTARVDAPNKRGCIDIGSSAGLHTIVGPSFADVVNGASDVNPLIYIHGGGGTPNGITVEGIRTDGSASKILFSGAPQFTLKNSTIDLSGSTRGNAVETFGADDVISDVFFSRCYSSAVYMGGARPTMRDLIATVRGVLSETGYIFNTIDTSYASMKNLRVHFEVPTARYGLGISTSARIEDTWVTNMTTTDSHVFAGAAVLRRANYRIDNPFTETAIT